MIGDTNLFFNESDQPNTAEIEIMIAVVTYRRKKRGWEATILMLLYGTCTVFSSLNSRLLFHLYKTVSFIFKLGINILNITKYIAKIKFDNEKSINMFEKLKFQKVIFSLNYSFGNILLSVCLK